ncbi:MAG: DUF1648 domain-containing protein [Candidatus Aminicenantes bacterium]|nr:DUF1648 domain-containing protein [Candidatus Aminicenantes bacterium]
MKIKAVLWLKIFNGLLLAMGWILAVYAYPRLPHVMPFWLNFSGQPVLLMNKSPLFFIYPAAQIIFFFVFLWAASRFGAGRSQREKENANREFVYLALIFFNLIFIHIQRSLILLAHGIEKGVDKLYFISLLGILLLLIPFYRLRSKILPRE